VAYPAPMIIEHALLPVVAGQEAEFEATMRRAIVHIASTPGFLGITVSRCVERPSTYLMIVEWERLEDHTEGFRGSDHYQQWRALLHHFYDPFPEVAHFTPIEL
jgi:heme-degrading monooxygenase HmoA